MRVPPAPSPSTHDFKEGAFTYERHGSYSSVGHVVRVLKSARVGDAHCVHRVPQTGNLACSRAKRHRG